MNHIHRATTASGTAAVILLATAGASAAIDPCIRVATHIEVPTGSAIKPVAIIAPATAVTLTTPSGAAGSGDELRSFVLADVSGGNALAQSRRRGRTERRPLHRHVAGLCADPGRGGNVLGAPAGVYDPAVVGGIHVLLAPLSSGNHTIHYQGRLSTGFCTEATYHLTASSAP